MTTDRMRGFLQANGLWDLPDAAAFVIAAVLAIFAVIWFNDFRSAINEQAEFQRRFGLLALGVAAIGAIYVLVRFVKWAWSLEF